jgi:glutaredoxin
MNVVIYTKDNCTYCTQAKMLLSSKGINYNEMKLGVDFARESLMETFPQAKAFPIVVVNGFNIGGYTELNKMIMEETKSTSRLLTEGEWNGA